MRGALAIAMCLLAISVAAPAYAYRTAGDLESFDAEQPIGWAQSDAIQFELAGELPEGIDPLAFDRAFDRATDTWATVNCRGPSPLLTWISRGVHEPGDGINTVGFVAASELPGSVPAETPAVTEVQYERDLDGQWRIVEADLYLNVERDWSAGAGFDVDLSTVLAHEMGHVIGLLHPCEPSGADDAPACDESHESQLMFPLYYESGTSLGEDDELGYCFLYPEPRCRLGERGCTIEPEESCDAGACDAGAGDGGLDGLEPDAAVPGEGACDAADGGCELPFASPCTDGDECASGLCIGDTSSSSTCTRNCGGDDGRCPSGFSCEPVAGQRVCVGPEPKAGCAVARPSHGRGAALAAWIFLSAFALLFRSARLRRCSSHNN